MLGQVEDSSRTMSNESAASSGTYPRIYAIVKCVTRGKVATYAHELEQRFLLERDGVTLDAAGRIPLARVRWKPPLREEIGG